MVLPAMVAAVVLVAAASPARPMNLARPLATRINSASAISRQLVEARIRIAPSPNRKRSAVSRRHSFEISPDEIVGRSQMRRGEPPLHAKHFGARIILVMTGWLFKWLLGFFNTVKVHHAERLIDAVHNRANNTGLFTVSNHASMLDPAIIAAVYPWEESKEETLKQWPPWTLCTDSFFANPVARFWLSAGKAMPIKRASPKGLRQKFLKDFKDKLDDGEWCHMYPEGKITQPWRFAKGKSRLGKFLPGVGKLITTCRNRPMLVPIYHKGMDTILPEEEGDPRMPAKPISLFPKFGKHVDIYVGEPIDLSDLVQPTNASPEGSEWTEWESESKDDLRQWLAIAKRVRAAMKDLEEEAWGEKK